MHTITVEISQARNTLDPQGWQPVDGLRRSQPVDPEDPHDRESFRALYKHMEALCRKDQARVCRTVNGAGVVYEFPAYQAYEAGRLMSGAGFTGWDASTIPAIAMVDIRISMS